MQLQLQTMLLWAVAVFTACSTTAQKTLLDVIQYFPDYSTSLPRIEFPCSEQERACFKENKLLFEGNGNCYSVGEQGPCKDTEIFHADKVEVFRKGGHLRGTCEKSCLGDDHAPLAATGECMSRSEVQSKICPADWYLQPKLDVFGQWVCEWSTPVCPEEQTKSHHYEASYNGLCHLPDIFHSSFKREEDVTTNDHIPDDHPLLQYFSNYTFLKREFPCTEEEKNCFQYGRMLGSDGNCYTLQETPTNCSYYETQTLDLDEANREGGKLQWICSPDCTGTDENEKDTRKCLEPDETYSQICRREWGLEQDVDISRRNTCKCIRSDSKPHNLLSYHPPTSVTPGFCQLPDFSNPFVTPEYDLTLTVGFEGPCSEEEYACLQEGKVLAMGACYSLRTRGPCAQGEELLLDKDALAHAQLKPKCASAPCPEGSVRMPIDGKCLTHQQAISVLCPYQKIALDEFGGWKCSSLPNFPSDLSSTVRIPENGTCDIPKTYRFRPGFQDELVLIKPVIATFSVGGGVGRR